MAAHLGDQPARLLDEVWDYPSDAGSPDLAPSQDAAKTPRPKGESVDVGAYEYLPAKDRMALVHYVQSLGAFPHGDSPAALEAFGKQFATAGERVPNKIPVSLAEEPQAAVALGIGRMLTDFDLLRKVCID